jgi:hypothetical protein
MGRSRYTYLVLVSLITAVKTETKQALSFTGRKNLSVTLYPDVQQLALPRKALKY